MRISAISNNTNFGRRLKENEQKDYKETIQKGLKVLDKELGIIVHNSTTPSRPEQNTGIGSLLSENAISYFVPMLATNGVSKIQQEPDNLRRNWNPSPYDPLTTGKNIYMIPLEKLTTDEYANILPVNVFDEIVQHRPNKEDNSVDFNYVVYSYDLALKEAYRNFKTQCEDVLEIGEPITDLTVEFADYKAKNKEDLEPDAIFEILTKQYNTDAWKTWDEVDRNLFNAKTDEQREVAELRLNEIRKKHADDIDFYIFKQMIAEKEISTANKANEKSGIKILGDSPIAFTPAEEWQNQDLFMDDMALGCPPDYFSADGQRWGFAVIKPEKIFNEDGSLGDGGKLMRKRYEKMFASSSGGARIDHIIGLIDPFVYSTKEDKMTPENSGRLYSSPNHPLLSKYAKNTDEQ